MCWRWYIHYTAASGAYKITLDHDAAVVLVMRLCGGGGGTTVRWRGKSFVICYLCERANLTLPLADVALNMPGAGGDCLRTDLCQAAVPPPQSWSGTRCSGEPCCRSHRSCWLHAPAAPTTPLRRPSGSLTPVKAEPSWHWRCGTTPAGPCGCWRAAVCKVYFTGLQWLCILAG